MNPGTVILLVILGSVALITVVTVGAMRFLTRASKSEQLHEDGIVLTEDGIEFLDFCWLGKTKVTYSELESVELIPFHKVLFSMLVFRYGLSLRAIYTRLPGQFVLVKLKGPRVFTRLLFTPKNPSVFVEQLKARIERSQTATA
jgi:hypothetical protein